MKLTLFFSIACFLQISATVYSQNTKFTFDVQNKRIVDILREVEDQSEFRFFYQREQVNVEQKINLKITDQTIENILTHIFTKDGIEFQVRNDNLILLKPAGKSLGTLETLFEKMQQRSLSGKVTDFNNQPLPGVTVLVKGTTQGTVTDINGNYSLINIPESATLVFSFVGMRTQEIIVGAQTILNVKMTEEAIGLDEIVVTAFGIEREKRSLGYSVGTINGDALSEVKSVNILNSLAGRVPGVNVRSLGSDAGASVTVQIRGAKNFSPTGSQPLYVVDGVPITGGIRFNGASDKNVDYGNASADINADNIEKISVLKGANAAALYGSRAANGVVLIETKKGLKAQKGIGANYTSSYMIDSPFLFPDFQSEFGQGLYGQFTKNTLSAWGPKLDSGIKAIQYNSPEDENGNKIPTELKSYKNNAQNFFQNALTFSNTLAITHRGDNSNMRISFNNLNYEGIVPNTDLKRNTLNFGGGFNAAEKFRINLSISFMQSISQNRPVDAFSKSNTVQLLYREFPPNVNIKDFQKYWIPGSEKMQQLQSYGIGTNNPYFVVNENLNGFRDNRLLGTLELIYSITPNLSIKSRVMGNFTDSKNEERQAFSSVQFVNGFYSISKSSFQEFNSDLMLGYQIKKGKDWYFSINAGGNFMRQYSNSAGGSLGNGLVIPGVYNLSNYDSSGGFPGIYSGFSEKEIHSVLGLGQIAWREIIYLDITGRNDWSSTLPVKNNSYFYPSASLSAIISDIFKKPSWLSLLKTRVGWSQVGSDTGPYMLSTSYSFSGVWNGVKYVSGSLGLPPFNLKSELLTSTEFGLDLSLFKGRIGLEATYYETINENQIFLQNLSYATGYAGLTINAGKIQNKGVEIGLNLNPIRKKVNWDIAINYTKNRNKILELGPDDTEDTFLQLASTRGVKIYGFINGSTSAMYIRGIERNKEGIPLTYNGIYKTPGEYSLYSGDYNPDFQVGFVNTISYRNFSLDMIFDWRKGGTVIDANQLSIVGDGYAYESLLGRNKDYGGITWVDQEGKIRDDGMILPGIDNETGQTNHVIIPAQDYHRQKPLEFFTFTGTYLKLRELSFAYNMPNSIINKIPVIQNVSVALQGRNLFLWTKDNLRFDPESAFSSTGGTYAGGVNFEKNPVVKSYGLKLNVIF